MAEFLVKRTGPAFVHVVAETDAGRAVVKFRVRAGGTRRVTIPDRIVSAIDPKHAKHLVRLALPEVLTEDDISEDESKTMPATPNALKISIEG